MELASPADKSQTQLGENSLQPFDRWLPQLSKKGCYISSILVGKSIDLLACRHLKLRGQNWSQQGTDNLLGFRQVMLNDQWPNYWLGRKTAWASYTHTISHAYQNAEK